MARILHLETSASVCSVAVSEDGEPIALAEHEESNAHSRVLFSLIRDVLEQAGWKKSDLGAVALSAGPGSYTGLRIGSSAAKGICFSLNLPLIAVDTLSAMAFGAKKRLPGCLAYVPILDARRMEVYTAAYDSGGQNVMPPIAVVIENNMFCALLEAGPVLFAGSGVQKCMHLLDHRNALFEIHARPGAEDMSTIAHKMFINNELEDIAYFEPRYLKTFWSPGAVLPRNI